MILYSLAPLAQQILPQEHAQNPAPTFTCSLSGGFLRGTMTERGFRVTGICSTDPAVYLKMTSAHCETTFFPRKCY